ncbi:hypothetical protein MTR_7g046035 [Medicago truncatula]|uniref:Uncharacterized protein n=1 Tax=Medicago truncatula TaxID=3880 RepID=A0A072TYC5_MEDTR|nr:hypothetical protein MTR_7g046035 [Medicago truncatula]
MSEDEDEESEETLDKISRMLGHLTRRSCKQKYQEYCPEDDFHLQRRARNRLKQISNKKVRPHEFQERNFVPKKALSFQPDSRGKWTPNYESPCALTLVPTNGDKLALPMNANAVKKYFVKK